MSIQAVKSEIQKARYDNVITLAEAQAIVASAKTMRVDEAAAIQALRKTLPQYDPATATQTQVEIDATLNVQAEPHATFMNETGPVMLIPGILTALFVSGAVDQAGINDSGKHNMIAAGILALLGLITLLPSIALCILFAPVTFTIGEIRRAYINHRD